MFYTKISKSTKQFGLKMPLIKVNFAHPGAKMDKFTYLSLLLFVTPYDFSIIYLTIVEDILTEGLLYGYSHVRLYSNIKKDHYKFLVDTCNIQK